MQTNLKTKNIIRNLHQFFTMPIDEMKKAVDVIHATCHKHAVFQNDQDLIRVANEMQSTTLDPVSYITFLEMKLETFTDFLSILKQEANNDSSLGAFNEMERNLIALLEVYDNTLAYIQSAVEEKGSEA